MNESGTTENISLFVSFEMRRLHLCRGWTKQACAGVKACLEKIRIKQCRNAMLALRMIQSHEAEWSANVRFTKNTQFLHKIKGESGYDKDHV